MTTGSIWSRHLANGQRGNADLCAYFFLRASQLLRDGGQFGFLATNTIAQGDTREVGLDQLTGERLHHPPCGAKPQMAGSRQPRSRSRLGAAGSVGRAVRA